MNVKTAIGSEVSISLPHGVYEVGSVSEVFDVRKEALKIFHARIVERLTGSDPKPVFLPEPDPYCRNYVGMLLVPIKKPQTDPSL